MKANKIVLKLKNQRPPGSGATHSTFWFFLNVVVFVAVKASKNSAVQQASNLVHQFGWRILSGPNGYYKYAGNDDPLGLGPVGQVNSVEGKLLRRHGFGCRSLRFAACLYMNLQLQIPRKTTHFCRKPSSRMLNECQSLPSIRFPNPCGGVVPQWLRNRPILFILQVTSSKPL